MRKITDIYSEYKIPLTLQEHMFRVASVIKYFLEKIDVNLDKKNMITAALLHDMGNIVKINFDNDTPINNSYTHEQKEYWKNVKNEYVEKYGENTDIATLAICAELGVERSVINLLNNLGFEYICDISNDSLEKQILKYGDLRVGFYGIISLMERINDANARYDNLFSSKLIDCSKNMERQILSHSKIKAKDITEKSIRSYMEKLKDFEI
jgi:hypothetical protein